MAAETFGQALGQLILQKRRAWGLTQVQLSEDAYGTAAKTRRISEIESGLVANPHPKTIDPIIAVLKITEVELEECAKRAGSQPDKELDRAYKEARNLIETIARQFEHNHPNATLAELDDFLRVKAAEWAELRDRISSIDAPEAAVAALKESANSALADGRFSDVDKLLAQAEEIYQNECTLIEIRKQAQIRITRGDNSLLSGDAKTASHHFKTAANFFRPFDEKEMARTLNEIAFRNYEVAQRSLNPAFFISAEILEILLDLDHIKNDPRLTAEAAYRLSLALRNDYLVPTPQKKQDILDRAIIYARKSASYSGNIGEIFQVTSMAINLANCLMDRAKARSSTQISDIKESISLLTTARENLRDDVSAQELRAHACNSLGAALLELPRADPTADLTLTMQEALRAFEESISVSVIYYDAESWGAAKTNIGNILTKLAEDPNIDEYKSQFLRIRAISEYLSAIEIFPIAAFPFRNANVHEALANVLIEHSKTVDISVAEVYLFRAIQSYETVSAIFTQQNDPFRWASAREMIGSIFAQHAIFPDGISPKEDLDKAAKELTAASAIFEQFDFQTELTRCRKKLASLQKISLSDRV